MDLDKGIASKAISYTIPVTKFMMEKLSEWMRENIHLLHHHHHREDSQRPHHHQVDRPQLGCSAHHSG